MRRAKFMQPSQPLTLLRKKKKHWAFLGKTREGKLEILVSCFHEWSLTSGWVWPARFAQECGRNPKWFIPAVAPLLTVMSLLGRAVSRRAYLPFQWGKAIKICVFFEWLTSNGRSALGVILDRWPDVWPHSVPECAAMNASQSALIKSAHQPVIRSQTSLTFSFSATNSFCGTRTCYGFASSETFSRSPQFRCCWGWGQVWTQDFGQTQLPYFFLPQFGSRRLLDSPRNVVFIWRVCAGWIWDWQTNRSRTGWTENPSVFCGWFSIDLKQHLKFVIKGASHLWWHSGWFSFDSCWLLVACFDFLSLGQQAIIEGDCTLCGQKISDLGGSKPHKKIHICFGDPKILEVPWASWCDRNTFGDRNVISATSVRYHFGQKAIFHLFLFVVVVVFVFCPQHKNKFEASSFDNAHGLDSGVGSQSTGSGHPPQSFMNIAFLNSGSGNVHCEGKGKEENSKQNSLSHCTSHEDKAVLFTGLYPLPYVTWDHHCVCHMDKHIALHTGGCDKWERVYNEGNVWKEWRNSLGNYLKLSSGELGTGLENKQKIKC